MVLGCDQVSIRPHRTQRMGLSAEAVLMSVSSANYYCQRHKQSVLRDRLWRIGRSSRKDSLNKPNTNDATADGQGFSSSPQSPAAFSRQPRRRGRMVTVAHTTTSRPAPMPHQHSHSVPAPPLPLPLAEHPDLNCPICLMPFAVSTQDHRMPIDLGCGHMFCDPCLTRSPQSFRRCPECRVPSQNPHLCYVLMRLLSSLPLAVTHEISATPDQARPSSAVGGRPQLSGLDALNALIAQEARVAGGNGGSGGEGDEGVRFRRGWQFLPSIPFLNNPTPSASLHPPYPVPGSSSGGRTTGSTGTTGPPPAGTPNHHDQREVLVGRVVLSELPNAVNEVRTSFWSWAAPVMGVIYLLSPLDLVPDFLPLIGWLDDMVVLGTVIYLIYSLAQMPARAYGGTHHVS